MNVLIFPGYGVNASNFSVIVEKINHWYSFEYNGKRGTRIVMDNGTELLTEAQEYEVRKWIEDMQ